MTVRRTVPWAVTVMMLAVCLLTAVHVPAADADTYESPDGVYGYSKHGSGSADPYWCEVTSLETSEDIIFVQSSLEGYPVTTITSLKGCESNTVVIPRTVTSFAEDALDGCDAEVIVFLGARPDTLPGGVELIALEGSSGWGSDVGRIPLKEHSGESSFMYYVIDGSAYVYGPSGDTDIVVPESDGDGNDFVGVDSEAFRGTDVTSVILGPNVAFIGTRAFYECESLTSLHMSGGVRDIRDEAFRYCTSLGDVDLEGVVTIGFETFRDCWSFRHLDVPDSLTSLGGGAFYICHSLEQVELGSGIDSIPERTFGYCDSLTAIDLTGYREIGDSAFIRCTSLVSVTLDPGLTSIGEMAFSGCTYLDGLDLGSGLESVGREAFSECRSLRELTFPETLESMGSNPFFHCYNLSDLYFMGDMPQTSGDMLFGTTDVAVHVQSDKVDSWSGFDGELVVEAVPSGGSSTAYVAAVLVIVCVILAVVLIRRRL